MDTKNIALRGALCTLAGGILWGFSGTCSQLLMTTYDVPAMYVTWVRMLASGVLFVSLMLVHDRTKLSSMITDRKTVGGIILYAIFGLFLGQFAYAMSIRELDAGTATVLQSLGVVILIGYTCIVKRKAPRKVEVIGMVMALSAVFIIATKGDVASLALPLGGLVWGIVNGCSGAFFAGYPRKLLAQWGSLPVMGCGMLVGGLFTLPLAHPWDVSIQWDLLSLGALVAIVVLGTFVSFALFLQGVKDLGGVKASLLAIVEPVSATFFAWALMGTEFAAIDFVGFALMLGMVVIVTLAKPEPAAVEEETPEPTHPATTSEESQSAPATAGQAPSRKAA